MRIEIGQEVHDRAHATKTMKIVTLACCHNRKQQTLNAIAHLYNQAVPETVQVHHVLVDDGSSDGTAKAIKESFPEVEIVTGTGELYWAGGMRFGWETAIKQRTIDYLLVYNDDISLVPNALNQLITTSCDFTTTVGNIEHVTVGAFCGKDGQKTTYSGLRRNSKYNPLDFVRIDPPLSGFTTADVLNMNFALISSKCLEAIGFLSNTFIHSGADFEYGLRLRKYGGQILVAPGYLGVCERNQKVLRPSYAANTLKKYLHARLSPKEAPFRQTWEYHRTYGGPAWPYLFLRQYITKRSIALLLSGKWL